VLRSILAYGRRRARDDSDAMRMSGGTHDIVGGLAASLTSLVRLTETVGRSELVAPFAFVRHARLSEVSSCSQSPAAPPR
jgi:hypothetical protein